MIQYSFRNWIIFENENLIIINKPPFISSLTDRSNPLNVLDLAREYLNDTTLCHRLDKETSGCLVIAKNAESYKHVSIQFEQREVIKEYHAIVEGNRAFLNDEVDLPIRVTSTGEAKIDKRNGKPSVTKFTTLENYKNYSLISCQPLSGRLHQIRVHLKYIKSPIIGDKLYGGSPFYVSSIKKTYKLNPQKEELPLIGRFALHAKEITFKDLNGETINIIAPYPKDFKAVLNQLKKHSR